MDISAEFVSAIINTFEANKRLADRAVAQLPDEKIHAALDSNTNSIAVIMQQFPAFDVSLEMQGILIFLFVNAAGKMLSWIAQFIS